MKKYAIMLGLLSLAASLSAIDDAIDNVSRERYVWNESHQGQNRIFKELFALGGFSFEVPSTAGQEQVRNAYIARYIDVLYSEKIVPAREENPILWDNKVLDRCLMNQYKRLKKQLVIIRVSNSKDEVCHDYLYSWEDAQGVPSSFNLDGDWYHGNFAKVTDIYGDF